MNDIFKDNLSVEYFESNKDWRSLLVSGLWYDKQMCHTLYYCRKYFYDLGMLYFKYSCDSSVLSISTDDEINSGFHYNVSTERELNYFMSYEFLVSIFSG